uniref:Uncharacterized protein n=1 Tax=Aegilops tauschii subsp. strangulata TaxID=200361 RepID=A0A453K5B4_AEGTS
HSSNHLLVITITKARKQSRADPLLSLLIILTTHCCCILLAPSLPPYYILHAGV